MKKEEIEEIRAHNGATVKINTSEKACEKYSGFKHKDFIIKEGRLAVAIGIGYNHFSLQLEFWKMELGDLGITSTDPKRWRKATTEEIVEYYKTGKRPEISTVEYVESSKAQLAIA